MTETTSPTIELIDSLELDIGHAGARRVYCNRDLNLASIQWVGFDMDYTLAIYRQVPFDRLCYDLTLRRLIDHYGYPEALLERPYDDQFAIRGLVIDRRHGHVIKMNVFRHVGKGMHGLRPLDDAERLRYRKEPPRVSSSRFRLIDTLFELPEAYLYAVIVDHLEAHGAAVNFERIADDVRAAIDTVHADGSLKSKVTESIATYISRDSELAGALHRLRSSGKKLFLLTNSDITYTRAVMSYLLDGRIEGYQGWRAYFDVVITDARKPSFFRGEAPFLRVADDGTVLGAETEGFTRGANYANGNIGCFERFIGLGGDEVLYVGDHIFGDILRSKLDSNWRTAMIIPEMERELESTDTIHDVNLAWYDAQVRLNGLHREIEARNDAIQRLRTIAADTASEAERARIDRLTRPLVRHVDQLKRQARALLDRTFEYQQRFDSAFHERWGSLFKEGNELSLFGSQVASFACIYTSRASNLGFYSPMHYFRSPPHTMPHEELRR